MQKTLWAVFIIVVIVVVAGIVKVAKDNGGGGAVGQVYNIAIAPTDWVEGSAQMPLTLVEYSDFQCPACGLYYPVLKQLRKEYATSTRFVYRNFPLPQHQNAKLAAYVAGAAGLQGKFFPMHDMIFEHQADWSDLDNAKASAVFALYAKTLGLDLAKFTKDLQSGDVQQKVDQDRQSGEDFGVNSTPTFYLNGKKLANPAGYPAFKTLLDAELTSLKVGR